MAMSRHTKILKTSDNLVVLIVLWQGMYCYYISPNVTTCHTNTIRALIIINKNCKKTYNFVPRYGALLNPSVFSSTPIDLTTRLETYLTIARKHVNKLVDVQRHVAWMLKKHAEPDLKMKLFQATNFNEIQYVSYLYIIMAYF